LPVEGRPAGILARFVTGWRAGVIQVTVDSGVFRPWVLNCPRHPVSKEPEVVWLKAIRGNDSFYVVQQTFRYQPTKEEAIRWLRYFRSVSVCDSRLDDRACPRFERVSF
jgi:hypothetical protein